ncbi:MAG: hypothetical protein MJY81_01995 [Bacteroidaceae bacterium]|nr:hypothetical protein [Bacteroidaceae bacterium]
MCKIIRQRPASGITLDRPPLIGRTAVAGLSVGIGNSRTLTGKEPQSTTTIHYFGNFVYDNGYLKYYFADGYTEGNGASYVHYYIKDHQGNNRVVAKYDGALLGEID